MLLRLRLITALFLLLVTGARSQEEVFEPSASGSSPNHFFFHPVFMILTASIDELPLAVPLTYERTLSGGNAFIWQAQLVVGNRADENVEVSQFGVNNYLGWRKYAHHDDRGLYLQGSGLLAAHRASFEDELDGEEASALISALGAVGYIGYKWTHVFVDIGGGYAFANGDLETSDGDEVEVSASGPILDMNLGIGF